jgi:4-amino-4-deoxy-L-arabinose transferase-like glycosyltransferase
VYDILEPFDVLLAGRIMSVLASMGTVVLTGVLAHSLAGPYAGAAAVSLAAVTPALVIRGTYATVDPYAAVFVVACLIVTDRSRTSLRPGLLSLLAGCFAGFAFASKYPEAIVSIAFGVTTLLQRIQWREKVRRIALAAMGLALGALVAMPALAGHPRGVYGDIQDQARSYAGLSTPSLWQQAVHRAEPDMPYMGSELGVVYLMLAAIGLAAALIDGRWTPTILGWLAFVAVSLILFGHYPYQPFRNLLPLVPLASIAVALLYVRVRQGLARPGWVDAVGYIALVWVCTVPMVSYAWERMHVVDTRTTTIDWLATNMRPDDTVVFVKELSFVNSELARLPKSPQVHWWRDAERTIIESQPRFIVTGVLQQENGTSINTATLPWITGRYALRLRLGESLTGSNPLWWRGNQEIIYIFERI